MIKVAATLFQRIKVFDSRGKGERVQIPVQRNRCWQAVHAHLLHLSATNTNVHPLGHSYLAGSKWKHVFFVSGLSQGRFLSPTMHRLVMHTPLV